MNKLKIFSKGFLKENAVFVLFLGLCPTLGVTTSAINGLSMGLATMSLFFQGIPKKMVWEWDLPQLLFW